MDDLTPELAKKRMERKLIKMKKQVAELEIIANEKPIEAVEMRMLIDMQHTIADDRSTFEQMADLLADTETAGEEMDANELLSDQYQAAAREALRLVNMAHNMRNVHNATIELEESLQKLESYYDADPSKNYTAPLKVCNQYLDTLRKARGEATMSRTHPLMIAADKIMSHSLELTVKMTKVVKTHHEVKPTIVSKDSHEGIKLTPFAPPTFSGNKKDWISFWSEFKTIHSSSRYADSTKLSYLRQAQQNPSLRRQIGSCIDNGDSYNTVVTMLQNQFDRPRLMHKIYVDQLLGIGQVKPFKSSILDCANTLQSVWDGLSRSGQCDAASIFTTVAENLLPKELRIRWEDETITSKKVPPVQQLIEFMRLRSTQPQYEDKAHYSNPAPEKKAAKPKSSGHHGSIHVASGQPVQSVTPQPESSKINSHVKNQSYSQKSRPQSFPPCKYTCPLCQDNHYAYSCRVFKEKAASKRLEHVVAHSLCVKCLKAGHELESCRNPRSCSVCQGEHNTLLHGSHWQCQCSFICSYC